MNATGRFWIVLAASLVWLPSRTSAQTPPTPAAADAAEPQTLTGLTPGDNGRVGTVSFADHASIAPAPIPANRPDVSVTARMAKLLKPEPVPPAEASLLEREINAQFATLDHCRTDVARRNGVRPAAVTVDSLTIRWTITGAGQVTVMEVVGTTPVDADVLDCIKRDTKKWVFTALTTGDLKIERSHVFRLLEPAPQRP
jgi:hypothetical protein